MRITALKASLAAVIASMDGALELAASEDNRDLTADEQTQFDAWQKEAEGLQASIKREESILALKASAAAPIVVGGPAPAPTVPATVKQKLEPGAMVGRIAVAIAATGGNDQRAMAHHAQQVWGEETGQIVANMEQSTNTKGGYLVDTDYSRDFIDLLRPQVVIRRLGARSVPMPDGNLTMRKKTAGTQASYVGERVPAPTTDMQVGQLTMNAKKLMALVPITNQLIRRASFGVDNLVRDDLLSSAAVKEDQQFLRGAVATGAPTGARYLAAAGNVLAMTADPDLLTVSSDLSRLILAVKNANLPMLSCGWVMSPTVKEFLANLRDGNGNIVYPSIEANNTLKGYQIGETTSVPDNLGVGGNESELYFGDWSQFLIGDTYQVALAASTEAAYDDNGTIRAAFSNDETVIRLIEEHDTQLRYDRAVSVLTGVTWKP
ncbi:phage major capsid protein [Sphingobium yanoikuyae]|uniref:phage major capsid protein n=1 Tax=Sphingobium yanoikuyae TaxID=13690 RepID=UPI0022DD5863|nr:phage major capsid protein [Sphingobium yanoikuyae]WBQ15032.1 phage major capsid protein [Sphingobium yanoikuyae]